VCVRVQDESAAVEPTNTQHMLFSPLYLQNLITSQHGPAETRNIPNDRRGDARQQRTHQFLDPLGRATMLGEDDASLQGTLRYDSAVML
jgi:hypothetical protein